MVSIQTPFGQLLKMPLLVEHYLKHQKHEGTSLQGFLEEHYSANHNDADLPEDEQLPFKNMAFNGISFAIVTPFVQTKVFAVLRTEHKISFPGFYFPQQYLASIFHPPQV